MLSWRLLDPRRSYTLSAMAEGMTYRKLHSDNNGLCLALGALHKLNIIRLKGMTDLSTANFFPFAVHE